MLRSICESSVYDIRALSLLPVACREDGWSWEETDAQWELFADHTREHFDCDVIVCSASTPVSLALAYRTVVETAA